MTLEQSVAAEFPIRVHRSSKLVSTTLSRAPNTVINTDQFEVALANNESRYAPYPFWLIF